MDDSDVILLTDESEVWKLFFKSHLILTIQTIFRQLRETAKD